MLTPEILHALKVSHFSNGALKTRKCCNRRHKSGEPCKLYPVTRTAKSGKTVQRLSVISDG